MEACDGRDGHWFAECGEYRQCTAPLAESLEG